MKRSTLAPGVSALTLKFTLMIIVAVVAVLATAAFLSLTNNSNGNNSKGNNNNGLVSSAQVPSGQRSEVESQGKSESKGESESEGGLESADVISSVDEIPVFEGARITNRSCFTPSDNCWLVLNTGASVREVTTFYREFLTKAGWIIIEERIDDEDHVAFSVVHGGNSAPSGSVAGSNKPDGSNSADKTTALPPIRRVIRVKALPNPVDGGTEVSLEYERWPDAREIPAYPGAEEVTVNWNVTKYPRYQRVTRFVTQSSPGDVEAYYKDVLSQLGWVYLDYEPVLNEDPDRSGIFFRYSRPILNEGLPEPSSTTSSVTLFTDPLPDNRTQVQLIAEGTEVEKLWEQEQQQEDSSSSPTP